MAKLFHLILASCAGILALAPPTTSTTLVTPNEPLCAYKADIVFVLDSSSSISQSDYNIQLDFVSTLTKSFDLGPKKVQFGAIDFSGASKIQFHLKDYTDHQNLEAAIKRAPKLNDGTYIELALDMARTTMFIPANGGRKDATRIIIVLTDGDPTNPDLAHQAYKKLKNAGILVVAIGIGSVHLNELNLLATSPNEVFKVDSYSVLHHIKDDVINKTCALPKICKHKADIILILDSSNSIRRADVGTADYIKELNFASQLTEKFDLSLVRFGAIIFSSVSQKLFDLNAYSDHASMTAAIMRAPFLAGNTHTERALNMVKNGMFDAKNGGRVNATKLVVILTDGEPQHKATVASVAKEVRDSGVHIIAIGVGHVNVIQLKQMASSEKDVFLVSGFDALHYVEEIVAKTACTAGES